MGCTTNGFVLTKEKDISKIWAKVQAALFAEILKETGEKFLWYAWKHKGFTYPKLEVQTIGGMFTCDFEFAGEQRSLNIHLGCNSDYSYYKKGNKIITSLGAWGQSVRLTEIVLRSLAEFGSLHIVDNDCRDEWRQLDAVPSAKVEGGKG